MQITTTGDQWRRCSRQATLGKIQGGCCRFDKGGFPKKFEFLRDKNINFLEVLHKAIKNGLLLRILRQKSILFKIFTQIFLKVRGVQPSLPKFRGEGLRPPPPPHHNPPPHFGAPEM